MKAAFTSVLILFLFLFNGILHAQDQGKMYFDKDWEVTNKKSEVVYYRKWKKLGEEKYLINDYYLDGTLQMKGLAKSYNEPLEQFGKTTFYHENGKVSSKGKYEKDKKEGLWKSYFENGDIESVGSYIEGDENGEWIGYYKDSILKYQGEYLMGDREGDWVWKYKNGQIAETSSYEEDKEISVSKGYYSSGKERFLTNYNSKGERDGVLWKKYKNGSIKMQGEFAKGDKIGEWKAYDANGQLRHIGSFKNGRNDGIWYSYYPTGIKESEISYSNGRKDGECKWYYESGNLSVQEVYDANQLKKTKAFSKEGDKINAELVNVAPEIKKEDIASLLNEKLGDEIKQASFSDLGIMIFLDENDKLEKVTFIEAPEDSLLANAIREELSSLSWNSRIIMNEKRNSKEIYFLYKNTNGELVPNQTNFYSDYSKTYYFNSYSNTFEKSDDEDEENEDDLIFTIVEEMPSFPGGENELMSYLGRNTRYPPVAKDAGIQGIVYITFVVSKYGKIEDVRVLRGIGGGCDEEALRVIRSMPRWSPGFQRGKPVRVQYNIPIRFILRTNNKK